MAAVPAPRHFAEGNLGLALVIALLLHGALIVGLGFKTERQRPGNSIEVTLAHHRSESAPKDSDYISQTNQQGSGDGEKRQEITTDHLALLESPVFQQTEVPVAAAQEESRKSDTDQQQLIAAADNPRLNRALEKQPRNGEQEIIPQTATEIASLRAKLARQRQLHGKIPHTLVLTTASARASEEAEYLRRWIQWVEDVGNDNYPEEARNKKIFGAIRLAVALQRDGDVVGVEILQSSGQRVLDQAAIRIVRLAAPFEPIPATIREDRIEIIRTWNFVPGNLFSSSGD